MKKKFDLDDLANVELNDADKIREALLSLSKEELELLVMISRYREEDQKLRIVEICDDDKEKMSTIYDVFRAYFEDHHFTEFFYSKKFGYIRMDKDGLREQYDNAEDLMNCIIYEIFSDVRDLKLEGGHMTSYMRPAEEEELRKRMAPYLSKLNDSYYSELFNEYIEDWKQRYPQDDAEIEY